MRAILVAVTTLGQIACGSKGTTAPPVCNHIAKVCGETYTAADVEKCAADWPGFQKEFGPDITATFVACTNDAKTCTEARQCSSAAVAALKGPKRGSGEAPAPTNDDPVTPDDPVANHRERFEDARARMEAIAREQQQIALDRMKNDPFFHDTTPLPPECARADELCPEDEPFARRLCRDMVGDLRGDDKHLGELVTCHNAAKSCAAFKQCRDDMWFKTH